jgi:uncharacterized membrane protein
VKNECSMPINLALHYRRAVDHTWHTMAFYKFNANDEFELEDENGSLHSPNRIVYYYAESEDKTRVWSGEQPIKVEDDERELKFRKLQLAVPDKDFLQMTFTCN